MVAYKFNYYKFVVYFQTMHIYNRFCFAEYFQRFIQNRNQ